MSPCSVSNSSDSQSADSPITLPSTLLGYPQEYRDVDISGRDALEPLAIVGFSLKFPQDATTAESFWSMLLEGRNVSTEFPSDRMNIDAHHDPIGDRQGTPSMRGAHFIKEDLGAFDAPFFSITPAEAAGMDPQQRGIFETAYRALENGK
ncbi:uncharacterized protein BP5553_01678 [Venustampulla echinocandica]|uniref:Ketosynthase family 3 (KS3) domain-containing protein n=1 Tax=Venustampulla echinocandica TaxID=2656787 RepID=A0A370U1N8_9HELO|nr:uncharacterized protein BP5553_01678 [Venustampulla echinocandica]RDL41699.1 hypothetical protein BP5553_01678 [Venustampulla echinocandica]